MKVLLSDFIVEKKNEFAERSLIKLSSALVIMSQGRRVPKTRGFSKFVKQKLEIILLSSISIMSLPTTNMETYLQVRVMARNDAWHYQRLP